MRSNRIVIWLVGFFLCTSRVTSAQNASSIRYLEPLSQSSADSLNTIYGKNKVWPEPLGNVILHTLSYFPELKDTKIKVKYEPISTTMNARPTFASLLFKKRSKRKYIVRINSQVKDSVVNIHDVEYNTQMGVLGHEFCHFVDYSEKGLFGVLGRLWSYRNKKSKAKYEQYIDGMTVQRGLGWQLYDWSNYVLNEADVNKKYKKLKEEVYLQPFEIKGHIRQSAYL